MAGDDANEDRRARSRVAAQGDLSRRLKRLGAELEARRPSLPPGSASNASPSQHSALGRAFRASTEFVAGVLVGGGLGWAFDRGLGTSPWGLIVFLMLGFAAGVFNVLRSAGLPTPTGDADRRDP